MKNEQTDGLNEHARAGSKGLDPTLEPEGQAEAVNALVPFTPGPWFVSSEKTRDEDIVIWSDGGEWEIAYVRSDCGNHPDDQAQVESEANARLIMAAPDLLESLEAVLADLQEAYDRNPEATAEWRSEIAPESFGYSVGYAKAAIAKARGLDSARPERSEDARGSDSKRTSQEE